MEPESLLTAEIRAAIGMELEPETIAVERRLVQRLLKATGDPNPRWSALGRQVGRPTARTPLPGAEGQEVPPAFLLTWMMSGGRMSLRLPPTLNWLMSDGELAPVPPFKGVLDGGGEWELLSPIRLGDALTSTMKIIDIRERTGRLGRMLIVTWETDHRNQRNQRVALSRGTLIGY